MNVQHITGGLAQWRQLSRRQYCGKLYVIFPQQVQWKPPLRQAAWTLSASGGQCSGRMRAKHETNKMTKSKVTMTKTIIFLSVFSLITVCNGQADGKLSVAIDSEIFGDSLSVEKKLSQYWRDTLYTQIDFSYTNKSTNNYALWIEKDDVSSLSENEKIRKHFFLTKGDFSLMQIIWDGNIGRFVPGLFDCFVKFIKPNEQFVVSIIVKGDIDKESKKISLLEKQIQLVNTNKIRGLNDTFPYSFRFSYNANNITFFYEWFDM